MKYLTSKLHLELLDKKRTDLLAKLASQTQEMVLGGGTGLSLQLAHRKSFDFDFFSQQEISSRLSQKLNRIAPISQIAVDSADELTFFTLDRIKVTFLYYPFKSYHKILKSGNLSLFPVKEIAVQKAYTLSRRGEYRDYFDLYTIFRQRVISLSEVAKIARKVYGNLFSPKLYLEQLVYFDDLLDFEIIDARKEQKLPTPLAVKQFLEEQVRGYLKEG